MENMKKHVIVLSVIYFVTLSFAQAPDTMWTKIYGGFDYDVGRSLQTTSDQGYIIAGETASFGTGGKDIYLIKTDTNGDTMWTRTYGGAADDWGNSVQQTSDGGYIVAGCSDPTGAADYDICLIKTDSNGDTMWTKTFGSSGYDEARSIEQTTDGGYIMTGITNSYGSGDYDLFLLKTNTDGDTAWMRTFGGGSWDEGNSVQQTSDGGYIIAGISASFTSGDYDFYLIKTDANGDTIWTKTYGMTSDEGGREVIQTSDDGYIVVGYIKCATGCENTYLIKTSSNGDTLWTGIHGNDYGVGGYSVIQTADGGFIVTGGMWNFSNVGFDVHLFKIDSTGQELWSALYGKANDWDIGLSVQQAADSGYIITGITHLCAQGNDEVYLIKTDPETGIGEKLISYPISIEPRIVVYPNPCRGEMNIIISNTHDKKNFSLRIYDISGRLVRDLLPDGDYSELPIAFFWDGKDDFGDFLSNGVYLLRYDTNGNQMTVKLTIVR